MKGNGRGAEVEAPLSVHDALGLAARSLHVCVFVLGYFSGAVLIVGRLKKAGRGAKFWIAVLMCMWCCAGIVMYEAWTIHRYAGARYPRCRRQWLRRRRKTPDLEVAEASYVHLPATESVLRGPMDSVDTGQSRDEMDESEADAEVVGPGGGGDSPPVATVARKRFEQVHAALFRKHHTDQSMFMVFAFRGEAGRGVVRRDTAQPAVKASAAVRGRCVHIRSGFVQLNHHFPGTRRRRAQQGRAPLCVFQVQQHIVRGEQVTHHVRLRPR